MDFWLLEQRVDSMQEELAKIARLQKGQESWILFMVFLNVITCIVIGCIGCWIGCIENCEENSKLTKSKIIYQSVHHYTAANLKSKDHLECGICSNCSG